MTTFREQAVKANEAIIKAMGEDVTFSGTFGPYTIRGVFEDRVAAFNDFTGEVVPGAATLEAKTSDIQKVKTTDTITVGLAVYKIISIADDDGYGLTKLTLVKTRQD